MFAQHTFIEDSHRPVMESVIRQNHVVTEKLLAKLYAAAWNVYTDKTFQPQSSENISISRVENKDVIVSAATDMGTGFYVQLAGEARPVPVGKHLTVGRKLAMQGRHDSLGQVATKLW